MLRVRGLHKSYFSDRNFRALKGVSLSLEAGEHVFVIGETGSGKSTLLKCIYGVEFPDKGSLKFNNRSLNHQGQLIPGFEGMRLVEQDLNLKKFNTVRSIVESNLPVGLTKREIKDQATKLLSLFRLQKQANKPVLELSGGQQQRVALAKAFCNLPELVLLDEPFAHLDPQLKNEVFQFLNSQIEEKSLSIITVTHDYNETLKFADRVVVLSKGKVLQTGSASEIFERPKDLYTAGLLGEFNLFQVGDKIHFIRPHEIIVEENGVEVVVKEIRFSGHYYEVELETANQLLLMYSQTAYQIGQSIHVHIPLKKTVNTKNQIEYES